jgi:archaeal flagellar protein FlaJ
MGNFFEEFGKSFIPEKLFGKPFRSNLRQYLQKAGINKVPYTSFTVLFFITAIFTFFIFISAVYPNYIMGKNLILIFSLSFIIWLIIQGILISLFFLTVYFYFNVKIFQRTTLIEKHLPDFLVLVSTNIKGGLSLEQAMWSSIRPEFELLAEEMTLVSKRVMTGDELVESLQEFANKYDSPNLQKNLELIIGEIKTGGKIVKVIDKIVVNLKKSKSLKQEMAASTVSYIIFIGAIVIVISPALFALSYQLLNIIVGFTSSIGNSFASSNVGINLNFNGEVDTANFRRFSVFALITISTGASIIISIIEKGDFRNGLKYIPIFAFSSVIFYLIFMVVLATMFGGMF